MLHEPLLAQSSAHVTPSGATIALADSTLQRGAVLGGAKIHLSDGRRTKELCRGMKNPNIATVDGQKIIGGAKNVPGALKK